LGYSSVLSSALSWLGIQTFSSNLAQNFDKYSSNNNNVSAKRSDTFVILSEASTIISHCGASNSGTRETQVILLSHNFL
jgi:hypothetical protein